MYSTHDNSKTQLGSLADNETLIFLHLMKTGGTTLFRLLQQQYSDDLIFHYVPKKEGKKLQDLQSLGEEKLRQLKFVHGHTQFGFHHNLKQPCKYITLLREPVSRVLSLYYFIHQNPNRNNPDEPYCPTLKSYLNTRRKAFNNFQTRTILGAKGSDADFGKCTDEMLIGAKQNLEKFLMVGTTERFDESVIVLKNILNLDRVLYSRVNENHQRPPFNDIAPEDLEEIEHYNQLDKLLYEYANHLLDEKISQIGDAFSVEYTLYQQANRQFCDIETKLVDTRKRLDEVNLELGQAYKQLEQERNSSFYGKVTRKLRQFFPKNEQKG